MFNWKIKIPANNSNNNNNNNNNKQKQNKSKENKTKQQQNNNNNNNLRMNLTGQPYGAQRTNKQGEHYLAGIIKKTFFFSLISSIMHFFSFFFFFYRWIILTQTYRQWRKKKGDQKRIKECHTASCGTHTTKWFIFHSFRVCCVPPRDVHTMAVGAVGMFSTGTSVDSLGTTMRWRCSRTVAPPYNG